MKGVQQNYGFPSEFTSEIPDCFPQSYGNLSVLATVNASQQVNSWPTNSSNSTIISRIGSPASAFYATEHYMGLSQYDDLQENNPQQFKHSYQRIPSFQHSGNGFFADSQARIEPGFQTSNGLSSVIATQASVSQYIRPELSYRNSFRNLSESEQLLHLKNKLLSDFDDSDTRSSSAPFDSHHDLDVSRNLYAPNFAHAKQFGRPPGCLSNTSCNNSVSSRTTRIRWSQDLHDRFVECVNRLGGPDKSTPKAILKLMDTEGLTIFHVKSHLQKYRNAKYIPESLEGKSEKMISGNNAAEIEIKSSTQLRETLQMQLDVQIRLHEQLEIQRNLQLRIEEQSKQLKMMFDQQQKTTRSLMETKSTNSKCPNNSSTTTLEDPEILVLDGSDDDVFFPSKIR